jgi:hypothetical protein
LSFITGSSFRIGAYTMELFVGVSEVPNPSKSAPLPTG